MRTRLIGLDIGSTTTRGLVLDATLVHSASGRPEVARVEPVFSPEPVLTPFDGDRLDLRRIGALAGGWWRALGSTPPGGGGVVLTGLAAAAPNAARVAAALQHRLGDATVVTADDPGLEAWLTFQAAGRALSLAEPERWFVNLDIGGGTTNLSAARAGDVERVGCLWIGARHVRVDPDGRVSATTPAARAAVERFGGDLDAVATFYVACLEAAVLGRALPLDDVVQLPFAAPPHPVITLSGGVGELVRRLETEDLPIDLYGDLGVRLAHRLRDSPLLGRDLRSHRAPSLGTATVLGLALHGTERPGATVFAPGELPGGVLPIRGRVRADDARALVHALSTMPSGGALQMTGCPTDPDGLRRLASQIADVLAMASRPIVLLVDADVGRILGQLATRWGRRPLPLVVLDELPPRQARLLRLGRGEHGRISVRYFGFT